MRIDRLRATDGKPSAGKPLQLSPFPAAACRRTPTPASAELSRVTVISLFPIQRLIPGSALKPNRGRLKHQSTRSLPRLNLPAWQSSFRTQPSGGMSPFGVPLPAPAH